MTIYAFIGEKASRTHENLMFQDFLEQLAPRWAQSSDWIYVVGNALWNGAEIDLVAILPGMLVVADFKSHRGRVTGAENGRWRAGGVEVKGGSHANPFVQLRNNKYQVVNWLKQHDLLRGQELGHLSAMVIFGGPIEDAVDLPPKVRSWFHVSSLDACAQRLDLLASPSLQISREAADRIVAVLGVEAYRWGGAQIHGLAVDARDYPDQQRLTEAQNECLRELLGTLRDPEVRTVSVTGMTSTGKTLLLAQLAASLEAERTPYQVLYPNSRLAGRARETHNSHLECSSVYRHLYFRKAATPQVGETAAQEVSPPLANAGGSSEVQRRKAKKYPLLANQDPEDLIYLIDDAHLLGNGYFETIDGKVFGSGCLVSDLFQFADLTSSRRKIVFFGDAYQLPRMSSQESLLEGLYQKALGLKHLTMELEQVYDSGDGGARLQNAIRLVDGMRRESYASLVLDEDDTFRLVTREQAAAELSDAFRHDPYACWTLFFSNAQVSKFTAWIRRRLFGLPSQEGLVPGDMLESVHVFRGESALEASGALYRGRRVSVSSLSPVLEVIQPLKGRDQPVTFHLIPDLCLQAPGLNTDTCRIDNLLLEHFDQSGISMSGEVVLAARVWYESESKERGGADDRANVERADEEDETSGIRGISLMDYGYGATVHHAQGMKQPRCYVDGHHQARSQSAGYFRWLYTAFTVAEKEVVLFNYSPIHAFTGMLWRDEAAKTSTAIKVGYGWLIEDRGLTREDEDRDIPTGLSESPRLKLSVAIWLRIADVVEPGGWKVVAVRSSSYLEKLTLEGPDGQATLSISYDGSQAVTSVRIAEAAHWPLLCLIAERSVLSAQFTPLASELVTQFKERMVVGGWHVVSAKETSWRLSLVIARKETELVEMQLNFDKAGRATSVSVVQHSPKADIEIVRELLQ